MNGYKHLQQIAALMRVRQWVKNGFVLAPLLFAGAFTNPASVHNAVCALFLFCIASSVAYIINDMRDRTHDRQHPLKSKQRPLASGAVRPAAAMIVLAILLVVLALGYYRLPAVLAVIIGYLALNLAYTYGLKHQPVTDIFSIAIGFVLRVYAGAVAISVPVSSWMFVTTLCLALYLAAIKRRQEMLSSGGASRETLNQYTIALLNRYAEIAATGALVFYSLFVMSVRPDMVITIPLVLYGLFRYWFLVETLNVGESPTDVLLGDFPLLLTVLLWIGTSVWTIWPGATS